MITFSDLFRLKMLGKAGFVVLPAVVCFCFFRIHAEKKRLACVWRCRLEITSPHLLRSFYIKFMVMVMECNSYVNSGFFSLSKSYVDIVWDRT